MGVLIFFLHFFLAIFVLRADLWITKLMVVMSIVAMLLINFVFKAIRCTEFYLRK